MVRAVVNHGEVRPLEPLPADWLEGQPLRIEKADDSEIPVEEIDGDFAVWQNFARRTIWRTSFSCSRAATMLHRQSKEQVRRDMGLT